MTTVNSWRENLGAALPQEDRIPTARPAGAHTDGMLILRMLRCDDVQRALQRRPVAGIGAGVAEHSSSGGYHRLSQEPSKGDVVRTVMCHTATAK